MTRSQMILRMPVENLNADLILHDGDRSTVMLFVPAGEDVARLLVEGKPFVPVVRGGRVCLIARAAIACVGVASRAAPPTVDDDELPSERQRATVKLRSGVALEGELRWVSETGRKRTTDYLNQDAPYFVLTGGDTTYFIVKAHVATVVET